MYTIRFTKNAMKGFRSVPSGIAYRVRSDIDALAYDPRPEGCQHLGGDDYRISSWGWIVEYTIVEQEVYIRVFYVG
jgi:hypothetical protein